MEQLLLSAEQRVGKGRKSELSALRRERRIPAVVYGGGKEPLSVVVSERELLRVTKAGGANAIITLEHPGGADTVMLKELKRHVVSSQPIHADFQRISLKAKMEVRVPLRVVGEAPGVKLQGGIMEHILRELKVKALPASIPHHIEVDVGKLELNQNIQVKDLKVPPDIEVLDSPDHFVVTIAAPEAEEAPAAPAEGAAAGAEPEVIAKGKEKEGEAAEGEKGEKGEKGKAAAAEAKAKPGAAPAGEKKKEGK